MGINIYLSRISDNREQRLYNEFDTARHAGDGEFSSCDNIDYDFKFIEEEEMGFHRPKDFAAAKKYVLDNVSEGNKSRLINVLNRMEADSELYFYFSF